MNMNGFYCAFVFILLCERISCISIRTDHSFINQDAIGSLYDDCDPSSIPVMESFDMKKFSGMWYELAKTVTGYIDVADGAWLIEGNNNSHNFLFSGRDNNQHCIRPIRGKLSAAEEPPGILTLRYKTYSTHVEETVRVLFTDYSSVAVIYSCMHHIHTDKEVCHNAGLFGAIWTRKPHVDVEVFNKAASYLEMACVHKPSLIARNLIGPCKVDHWDFRIDDFPAPDYCYQMLDLGSCTGNLQRFYYDAREKTCKQFIFGGCGGNNNNFMSNSECQKKCATASNKDPVCMSTAKCGLFCSPCCTEDVNGCVQCNCEHIAESEDNHSNCISSPSKCPEECDLENIYQGCYVCKCGGRKRNDDFGFCNEVKNEGNCNDAVERYYFDAVFEKCQQFTYSGCGGNNNNFQTLQECKEKCLKPEKDNAVVMKTPVDAYDPDSSPRSSTSVMLTTVLVLFVNIYCLNFISH